jgi:hypothetical protein
VLLGHFQECFFVTMMNDTYHLFMSLNAHYLMERRVFPAPGYRDSSSKVPRDVLMFSGNVVIENIYFMNR